MAQWSGPDTSDDTLSASGRFGIEQAVQRPALTLLWHPQRARIGARAPVLWDAEGRFELSRWAPLFRNDDGEQPLDDRRITRKPVVLGRRQDGGLWIQPPATSMPVSLDGVRIGDRQELDAAALDAGVVLCLGRCIVLCLHHIHPATGASADDVGLIGSGQGMQRVRRLISQAAASPASVLIHGETGTGKELVARAIHQASDRADHPMVSVNMGALGAELAAAELFGVRKGAYTGATEDRPGLFREASGSTLFLDEIGDASPAIQVMLLRVLEDGMVRSVGGRSEQALDVRVLAATDRELSSATDPSFNQPLRRRLEALTIRLPPLRERREDFGELLVHFLTELEDGLGHPVQVPAEMVELLARQPWNGNVRELRNFITGLSMHVDAEGKIHWDPDLARRIDGDPTASSANRAAEPRPSYRDPVTVTDAELLQALDAHGWRVMPSARTLGVSRTTMYALMKRCNAVRTAEEIPVPEIERVMGEAVDLDQWAARLKTPREGLKRRIRELGLG